MCVHVRCRACMCLQCDAGRGEVQASNWAGNYLPPPEAKCRGRGRANVGECIGEWKMRLECTCVCVCVCPRSKWVEIRHDSTWLHIRGKIHKPHQ